jgi:hypothetical protein
VKVATVCGPESAPSAAVTVKPPVGTTAGSLTVTVKVLESNWPSLVSVTVSVAVYDPSSP